VNIRDVDFGEHTALNGEPESTVLGVRFLDYDLLTEKVMDLPVLQQQKTLKLTASQVSSNR